MTELERMLAPILKAPESASEHLRNALAIIAGATDCGECGLPIADAQAVRARIEKALAQLEPK